MGNFSSSHSYSASRRRYLVAAASGGLTALVAACNPAIESVSSFQGTDITDVQWGRGFDLTDHTGRRRTFADFKGRVVLLFFGFTNCPDVCPIALAEMAQVVKQVGADRAQEVPPFGTGVAPLLQWVVVPPLAYWLATVLDRTRTRKAN